MLSCKFCSRTFWDEEKFEQHVRICEDVATDGARAPHANSPGRSPSPNTSPASPSPKHLPSLLCHICGKQFGTASLEIHMRQCAKKWEPPLQVSASDFAKSSFLPLSWRCGHAESLKEQRQATKPAELRRALPHRPERTPDMTQD